MRGFRPGMTEPLAGLLGDALSALAHDVESVSGDSVKPRDLFTSAVQAAALLRQHDVRSGEPVHVRIGNRPTDLASLLAVWQAGAVGVPVHVAAAASTIARVHKITRARFLIDAGVLEDIGDAVPPERKLLRNAALVVFTSGSTGEPKGVIVAHQRLADKLAALAGLLQFQSCDIVLVPLQITFIFGLWVSLLTLMAGARLVLVPRFAPEAIQSGLGGGATILAGVPSMFRTLLADTTFCAPRLRMLLSGGEVLPRHVAEKLLGVCPQANLYDLYGSTETGSCDFCLGPLDQPEGLGTIGRPTKGVEFRLHPSAQGQPHEGAAAELQIRTPFAMLGYLDQPELTAAAYEDGYFKTGDLAWVDKTGRVVLIGRSKEIISRGGIKIAPLEVENLLCEHPDIAAALCTGLPDERFGETVHAIVVPRAGARLEQNVLRAWMLARTERFKVPDSFIFRDVLPIGPSGKIDRRALAPLLLEASNQET
jgi:long-chain acyl-CoA synthetase